jgi:hypothetical protein
MSTLVTAEYDATRKVLRLVAPAEGLPVDDGSEVAVTPTEIDPDRPWLAFSGCLSKEAGDELAAIIDEMFPIEK